MVYVKQHNDGKENQDLLKKLKELIEIPLVFETFLQMMGADCFIKSMNIQKKQVTNRLPIMVNEMDKFCDQKIQKLRYILKNNLLVRHKMVEQTLKQFSVLNIKPYIQNLEENLGLFSENEKMVTRASKSDYFVKNTKSNLQIKS